MNNIVTFFFNSVSDLFEPHDCPEDKLLYFFKEGYPTIKEYGGNLENYNEVKDLLKNNSILFYNACDILSEFGKLQKDCPNKIIEYLKNATQVYNKVLQENYEEIIRNYQISLEYLIGIKPLKTIYQQILDKYGWNESETE
jgi:hypothetical protein